MTLGYGNPLIESGVIVVAGLILLTLKRHRTATLLIIIAFAWAWLCSTPVFALMLRHGLASQFPTHSANAYPRTDAIVLVGGGTVPKPLEWEAAAHPAYSDPFDFAIALYKAGKAPLLVTTGSYATPRAAKALMRQGVPHSALQLEPASQTTHEDALYSWQALKQARGKTILLVTTGSHMPRTVATFQSQGFRIIPAPALRPKSIDHWPQSLLPYRYAFYLSQSCLHEYIGMFYYRMRGWATW